MKLTNKRSGFTLLEIIIVIIIVGVLASLALPRFFNTIEYSRSTEALNAIGVLKRAADRCATANEATGNGLLSDGSAYGTCGDFGEIGVDDPGNAASAVFSYGITYVNPDWEVVATRVGGPAANETITFSYNVITGITTRTGSVGGPYEGLK